jgi:small subunit ribosomal protein S17
MSATQTSQDKSQAAIGAAVSPDKKPKNTRTLTGRVVSDKMNKTRTVVVERRVTHKLYGKIMVRSKKYHFHDEANESREGDLVLIEECRPLSKTKAWKLSKLLEKARIV